MYICKYHQSYYDNFTIEYLSKVSKGVCDIDCTVGVEIMTTTVCHQCQTVSIVLYCSINQLQLKCI